MIGKIMAAIIGFVVGTLFGYTILSWLIKTILENLK